MDKKAVHFPSSVSTCIRAMDLIKIANQIYNDGMKYVEISINLDESDEDLSFAVRLSGAKEHDSEEVKQYPVIPYCNFVDCFDWLDFLD